MRFHSLEFLLGDYLLISDPNDRVSFAAISIGIAYASTSAFLAHVRQDSGSLAYSHAAN
jgi:hypothetical protein